MNWFLYDNGLRHERVEENWDTLRLINSSDVSIIAKGLFQDIN